MGEEAHLDFTQLRELTLFSRGLRAKQVDSLSAFLDSSIPGFVHTQGELGKRDRMSLSSASTCIVALLACGSWIERTPSSTPPLVSQTNERRIVEKLFDQDWVSAALDVNNVFSTAFALEAITQLIADGCELPSLSVESPHTRKFRDGVRGLMSAIVDGSVRLGGYPPSAFLTQLLWRVLSAIRKSRLRDHVRADSLERIRRHVAVWSLGEIEHQLALHAVQSKLADPFQLLYALMLFAETRISAERQPDDRLLLNKGLTTFFALQRDDGTWPRSQPLFHYPNTGSAYCFEYEALTQLLSAESLRDACLHFLPKLAIAAYALRDTAVDLPKNGYGWSSGHHPQVTGPESWSTASAYHFVFRFERLLAEAIRRVTFAEVGAPYEPPQEAVTVPFAKFATGFWDCPLWPDATAKAPLSLKKEIYDRLVNKVAQGARDVADGRPLSTQTPVAAIFFGPPGTSKTELSKIIAETLRWPRLAVDPSYFVKHGIDRIQAQADKLFDMLAFCERVVVLLDEFDEMVRDRSSSADVLSRFLTTAMLPKLATINKARRLVFIVATNYIQQFDAAISRKGRFDLIIQVMPPTADAKILHCKNDNGKLAKFVTNSKNGKKARELLELLTYDEFSQIVDRIAACASPTDLVQVLQQATDASTLRLPIGGTTARPRDVDGDDQGNGDVPVGTWEAACVDQRKRIRLQ